MHEDRDLDCLIDEALRTYAHQATDANLIERILSRLANEPASKARLGWVPWAAALTAAICLVMLVLFGPKSTRTPALPMQNAQFHNPAGLSARPRAQTAKTAKRTNRDAPRLRSIPATAASQPLPKLDMFPTPSPLTSQDRALAIYVAHTPRAELQALARSEQEQTPLTVASIHVMPLDWSDDDTNTN